MTLKKTDFIQNSKYLEPKISDENLTKSTVFLGEVLGKEIA